MTPEQLERLVRLEERVNNLVDDSQELRIVITNMSAKIDRMSDAINTAAAFGRGSLWTFTKIVAIILGALAALDWLTTRVPFLHK